MRAMIVAALLLSVPAQALGAKEDYLAIFTAGELTSTIYTDLLGSRTTTTSLERYSGVGAQHLGPQIPGAPTDYWAWDTLGHAWISASSDLYGLSVSAGGSPETLSWLSGESYNTTGLEQVGWVEFDVPRTRRANFSTAIDSPLWLYYDGELRRPPLPPFSNTLHDTFLLTAGHHRMDWTLSATPGTKGFNGTKNFASFWIVPEPPAWCLAVGLVLCGLVWFRNR